MKREFKYEEITLYDISINNHLIFICLGDEKKVIVEKEEEQMKTFDEEAKEIWNKLIGYKEEKQVRFFQKVSSTKNKA